jgi:hypothetical protein
MTQKMLRYIIMWKYTFKHSNKSSIFYFLNSFKRFLKWWKTNVLNIDYMFLKVVFWYFIFIQFISNKDVMFLLFVNSWP